MPGSIDPAVPEGSPGEGPGQEQGMSRPRRVGRTVGVVAGSLIVALLGSIFAFGLGHYWRDGRHIPGRMDLWQAFKNEPQSEREAIDRHRLSA